MKKRKNLLKTLALCSVVGLGVGYAVVSNQTLTYTETIPVGERAINVKLIHPNVSEDGLTITITHDTTLLELMDEAPYNVVIAPGIINNETELNAQVSANISIKSDTGEDIPFDQSQDAIWNNELGVFTNILPAGMETYYSMHYSINKSDVEKYNTIIVTITFTAIPTMETD